MGQHGMKNHIVAFVRWMADLLRRTSRQAPPAKRQRPAQHSAASSAIRSAHYASGSKSNPTIEKPPVLGETDHSARSLEVIEANPADPGGDTADAIAVVGYPGSLDAQTDSEPLRVLPAEPVLLPTPVHILDTDQAAATGHVEDVAAFEEETAPEQQGLDANMGPKVAQLAAADIGLTADETPAVDSEIDADRSEIARTGADQLSTSTTLPSADHSELGLPELPSGDEEPPLRYENIATHELSALQKQSVSTADEETQKLDTDASPDTPNTGGHNEPQQCDRVDSVQPPALSVGSPASGEDTAYTEVDIKQESVEHVELERYSSSTAPVDSASTDSPAAERTANEPASVDDADAANPEASGSNVTNQATTGVRESEVPLVHGVPTFDEKALPSSMPQAADDFLQRTTAIEDGDGSKSESSQQTGLAAEDLASAWEGYSERPEKPAKHALEPLRKPSFASGDVSARIPPNTNRKQSFVRHPRLLPAIDGTPFQSDNSDAPLPEHYLQWNHLFGARIGADAGSEIHLAASPRSLAAMLTDFRGVRVSPADAELDFKNAVREAYHLCAARSTARFRVFQRYGADGMPLCIGILAASVLAAHYMHSSDEATSGAYYIRLSALLGVTPGISNMPLGFRTEDFERLWLFLAAWVARQTVGALALPERTSHRRYIEYPLSHVPLRQLDLEKLPRFFDWAGYSPGSTASPQRLESDLKRWSSTYQHQSFSQAGRDALADARSVAVVAQVRNELRAWDGVVPQSQGAGAAWAHAELLLETAMRQTHLAILAHKPEGFPQVFQHGEQYLQGGELWYDPRELRSTDGDLLRKGFVWPDAHDRNKAIRRPGGLAFVLAPTSLYSGRVSRDQIPLNAECSVLCHESIKTAVESYLSEICQGPVRAISPLNIPQGWHLFLRVFAKRRCENVPENLQMLGVSEEIEIIPQGGLRIGSQMAWMQGGAPLLFVEGYDGQSVSIDENPVGINSDGAILAGSLLDDAGFHVIKAGSVERRISIVEPLLRYSGGYSQANADASVHWPVIIGPGNWILLGSDCRNAAAVKNACLRQSIALCAFDPVWAVQVGAGRGAIGILLRNAPPSENTPKPKAEGRQWVSTIYEAGIRRPNILSAKADANIAEAKRVWQLYVARAKVLKRQWRTSST